jgi:formylglycine-generating enzyme required for sulfatase activity
VLRFFRWLSVSGGWRFGRCRHVARRCIGCSEHRCSGSVAAGDASNAGGSTAGAASGGTPGDGGGTNGGSATGGAPSGAGGALGASGSKSAGGGNAGSSGSPGASGTSGSGGNGSAGGTQLECPAGATNRASQEVPLPDGSFYCIDHGEVRNSDYKQFLDANPSASAATQVAACSFNTSYAPDTTNGCDQYDPVNSPDLPIACVDWCDAAAFCKWDGKHLCGALGGGTNAPADFADPTKSAWYRACSHAGAFDFPYGNTYKGTACVGLDNTAVHPLASPVTSCVGGYDGLYDMSGNVAEWEDSCTGNSGASDLCLDRGGSYLDTNVSVGSSPSLQCNSNVHGSPKMATKARSTRDKEIGFRCCSEPVAAAP